MKTPLLASYLSSPGFQAGTFYLYPMNGFVADVSATEVDRQIPIPCDGTLSKLTIETDTGPGTSKTYVITLRKNGSDTALTLTLSNTETSGADNTNSVSVSAGDLICFSVVGTAGANNAVYSLTAVFEGSTAGQQVIFGGCPESLGGGFANTYCPLQGLKSTWEKVGAGGDEAKTTGVVPHGGTIKRLYVNLKTAPGSGKSRTLTLRKNGSDQTTTTTISDTATTGNDTSNSFAVTAGDRINIHGTDASNPASSIIGFSCVYEPTTDGYSILMTNPQAQIDTTTKYISTHGAVGVDGTEANRKMRFPSCSVKNLYYYGGANTVGSHDYTLRKNGSGTALTVNIGNETADSDTSNTVTISADDDLDLQVVGNSSPNGSGAETLGMVVILPITTTQTILSDARIQATTTQTILSDARIQVTTTQTILSDAMITTSTQQTILSDARIQDTTTQTILSDARIQATTTQTILSDARIQATTTQTILSDARVAVTVTQTILSDAKIKSYVDFECRFRSQKIGAIKDFDPQFIIVQPTAIVPTNLVGTDLEVGDAVYLSWDDVGNYGYNVYKKVGMSWVKQNTEIVTITNYTVGGLTTNVSYDFMVRGTNGADIESANSNEVTVTPTIVFNRTAIYKVYINNVWREDAILHNIELVYGPTFSTCTFELLKPVSSGPDVEDEIKVTINDRQVFLGTLVTIDDTLEAQNQQITYTAVNKLWEYSWKTCLRDYNDSDDQEAGIFFTTRGITTNLSIPSAPVDIYPGSVSVTDSTKLDAMVTVLGYCGNYKIYTSPYGAVSYYHMGTGPNRILEVGKQILAQNIRTDITDKVDKVTIYRQWRTTFTATRFFSGLSLVEDRSNNILRYRWGPITGRNISNIQVSAYLNPEQKITYDENSIEIVPGHCGLETWEDGTTEPKRVVIDIDPPTPSWQNISAEVVYTTPNWAYIYIPFGTNGSAKTVNLNYYIAKLFLSTTAGDPPVTTVTEVDRQVAIADSISFATPSYRVTWTYEVETSQSVSTGSGDVERTFHDDNIQSDINSRLDSEYDKLSKPTIGGEIVILGDETVDLKTRVNNYDVVRVVHDFTQGFTTRISLTNEPFYRAVLNNRVIAQKEKNQEKVRDARAIIRSTRRKTKQDKNLSGLTSEHPNKQQNDKNTKLGGAFYTN